MRIAKKAFLQKAVCRNTKKCYAKNIFSYLLSVYNMITLTRIKQARLRSHFHTYFSHDRNRWRCEKYISKRSSWKSSTWTHNLWSVHYFHDFIYVYNDRLPSARYDYFVCNGLLIAGYIYCISLSSMCFRQLRGTPAGSNPDPFTTNFFCMEMKGSGFFKYKKWDLRKAQIFTNI